MNTALLIIDVQQGLCEDPHKAFESAEVIGRINQVSAKARAAGILVEDAHTTEGNAYLTARQVIQHHNATLTNISSFGPRVRAVSSEALQIGA